MVAPSVNVPLPVTFNAQVLGPLNTAFGARVMLLGLPAMSAVLNVKEPVPMKLMGAEPVQGAVAPNDPPALRSLIKRTAPFVAMP